ncbi:MAG: hypothetical protein ACR2QF_02470 [Geminicoccaceae bacterium]
MADPIKTGFDSLNTNITTAFNSTPNIDADEDNSFQGAIGFQSSEITISAGAASPTRTHHTIDTESDAATDDLDTLSTGNLSDGAILIIRAENAGRTVVLKHEAGGAGQLHLAKGGDFSLDDGDKSLILQRRGTDWYEPRSTDAGIMVAVQQATRTDTDSTTGTTFADITGLSITTNTPASPASRFRIKLSAMVGGSASNVDVMFRLMRDSTAIGIGDAAGSRERSSGGAGFGSGQTVAQESVSIDYIDSPVSSAALTYKVQWRVDAGTGYLNRDSSDGDASTTPRYITTLIVEELRE